MSEQDQPGFAGAQPPVEPAKDIVTLTAQLSDKYPASGDSAQSKTRKTRSDAGKPRGPRGVAAMPGQDQAMGAPGAGKDAGYTVDKKIVERTAGVIFGSVDAAVGRKIYRTAKSLGGDDGISANLAKDAGLTVPEHQLMCELTGVVFEKYGMLTGYAPEILLAITVGEWATRITLVMHRLNVMAKEQAAERKKHEADTQARKNNSDRKVGDG